MGNGLRVDQRRRCRFLDIAYIQRVCSPLLMDVHRDNSSTSGALSMELCLHQIGLCRRIGRSC